MFIHPLPASLIFFFLYFLFLTYLFPLWKFLTKIILNILGLWVCQLPHAYIILLGNELDILESYFLLEVDIW